LGLLPCRRRPSISAAQPRPGESEGEPGGVSEDLDGDERHFVRVADAVEIVEQVRQSVTHILQLLDGHGRRAVCPPSPGVGLFAG
jgi:hypothetical protein